MKRARKYHPMKQPEPKLKRMTRLERMRAWARRRARTLPGYHMRKLERML